MKDLIKTALGLGITIGLSDRETFVKSMSDVINKYQEDPTKGDQWAETLVNYLEQTRNNINLQNAVQSAMGGENMPDKESIDDLAKAVKELTEQMKRSQP